MIRHFLTMAGQGLLFWVGMRIGAALTSKILKVLEPAFAWLLDPFFEWVGKMASRFIVGHIKPIDDLSKFLRRRHSNIQVWGFVRGDWGVGFVRMLK